MSIRDSSFAFWKSKDHKNKDKKDKKKAKKEKSYHNLTKKNRQSLGVSSLKFTNEIFEYAQNSPRHNKTRVPVYLPTKSDAANSNNQNGIIINKPKDNNSDKDINNLRNTIQLNEVSLSNSPRKHKSRKSKKNHSKDKKIDDLDFQFSSKTIDLIRIPLDHKFSVNFSADLPAAVEAAIDISSSLALKRCEKVGKEINGVIEIAENTKEINEKLSRFSDLFCQKVTDHFNEMTIIHREIDNFLKKPRSIISQLIFMMMILMTAIYDFVLFLCNGKAVNEQQDDMSSDSESESPHKCL
ncbi:hypothetical protein TRFO_13833 [Tritrichomonas foetus]|uniref:Uncharacterized protein n=1 Tax=Tritrichomonas foetus TaxID=1144522 RepID=A0A1J4KX32_9EUKA|nr:hypothetical protein TRFO_13833 [Tritrichomonas foetus]|eukprot:OHT15811.1 hypothetical protein TRFO_13833 [Tritrichomonas foetus]